jgi:hypothetical protein
MKVTALPNTRAHCALKSVYISKLGAYVKRFFNFFQLSDSLQSVDVYNKVSSRLTGPGRPTGTAGHHPEKAEPDFPPFLSDSLLYLEVLRSLPLGRYISLDNPNGGCVIRGTNLLSPIQIVFTNPVVRRNL